MKVDRYDPSTAVAPPEPTFTGDVRIDKYFSRGAPSSLAGALVRFAPGARTPWKVNPLGQTLVILDGLGRAQQEGGAITELQAGDVVWCSPGIRHWEGAAPGREVTYLAMQETQYGTGVTFYGPVPDHVYGGDDDGNRTE